MAAEETADGAQFDTRADAGNGDAGLVRLWLEAIELQDEFEKDWRASASDTVDLYRDKSKNGGKRARRFNILATNTDTLAPALYNSTPIPDVRPRYMSGNPLDKQVSQVIERALSFAIDNYDFNAVMRAATKDRLLPGRAVSRVRYEPKLSEDGSEVVYEAVTCEPVNWADFRIGPATTWAKTPWIAYRHYLTREQVVALNPRIGASIPLDSRVDGKQDDKDNQAPDVFKRLLVWEIWDKEAREIIFIAPSYKLAPLKKEKDTLRLEGFFDIPRPMLAIETTDTQEPIEPYRMYKDQAEELDLITRRITALTSVMKVRGIYAAPMAGAFEQMASSKDGEYTPSENVEQFMQGGLTNAVWSWPIEVVSAVLERLYLARDQVKATIFEITGVADVMRGQTDSGETLGAQQLKAQWGSLRLQEQQGDVQRYARDLLRLKAEIIATKFSAQTLTMMTGVEVTPEMEQVLRSDIVRSYRIDIETDSTIQADVQKAQQQAGQFIQGAGTFFQAIGPAVQTGAMPPDVAIKLFMGLARPFKLGKQAEDALDAWEQETTAKIEQQKQQPPQPPPPDPAIVKAQMDMQAKQAELQQSGQIEQQKLQIDAQDRAGKSEIEKARLAMEAQFKERELAIREREAAIKEREAEVRASLEYTKIQDGQAARHEQREAEREGALMPEREKLVADSENKVGQLAGAVEEIKGAQSELMQAVSNLARIAALPKRLVRGPDGRAVGSELVVN
jgi:hypothetical protein